MPLSALKISIRLKILGLPLTILALLVATSSYTYYQAGKVVHELNDIARFMMPLEIQTTQIGIRVLEQEIDLERLFHRRAPDSATDSATDPFLIAQKAQFETWGEQIQRSVVTALQHVRHGIEHAQTKQDIVDYAQLEANLVRLGEEHLEYQRYALPAFTHSPEDQEAALLLRGRLKQEEEDISRGIDGLTAQLEKLTDRSVATASRREQHALQMGLVLAGAAAVLGLSWALFITTRLTRPVRQLLDGTRAIHEGRLDHQVENASQDEIGELSGIFNQMVGGLRDLDRLKSTFGQYLDPRIVGDLIQRSGDRRTEGSQQVMTVFFSDIAGFSSISEMLTPDGLVNLINQYLNLAAEPITRSEGIIDKYIGDAVVAFWGPPYARPEDHARLACGAALDQFEQLDKLARRLPGIMGLRQGLPTVEIRVGLATGSVLAGDIGPEQSRAYTILGPPVYLAEELQEANKIYGTRVMIDEATRDQAGDAFETRYLDRLRIGDHEPICVYELLTRRGELTTETAQMRDAFEAGLQAYFDRSWDRALHCFGTCLKLQSNDQPAAIFMDRVRHLQVHPPAPDWDGAWM